MSLGHGASVSRNGLVFYYDINNTDRSWKGKPTTNLVAAPYNLLTGFGKAAGVTVTNNVAYNVDGSFNVGLITGTGWIAYTGATTTNGQQYTTSWVVRKTVTSVTAAFGWGGSHQGNLTTFTFNFQTGAFTGVTQAAGEIYGVRSIGDFWVVYYSSTLTSGNAYYPQITIGTGVDVYFGGIQIEAGNVASPIVTGTRSNTQAILDMTGTRTITANNLVYASNNSFTFDGAISILSTTYTQTIPNSFTVESWVNITEHSGDTNIGKIISMCYSNYNGWIFSLVGPSSALQLRHHNVSNSSTSYNIAHTSGISLNTWYHLAATDDGSTVRLYINGVQVTSGSSAVSTTNGTMNLFVGGWQGAGTAVFLKGNQPSAKIYSRALTPAEILQNFNAHRGRYGI